MRHLRAFESNVTAKQSLFLVRSRPCVQFLILRKGRNTRVHSPRKLEMNPANAFLLRLSVMRRGVSEPLSR